MSGLYFLPISATISPSAIFQGRLIAKTGRYRMIIFTSWCFMLLGVGLIYSMDIHTALGPIVVFQLIQGFGMGLGYATTVCLSTSLLQVRCSPIHSVRSPSPAARNAECERHIVCDCFVGAGFRINLITLTVLTFCRTFSQVGLKPAMTRCSIFKKLLQAWGIAITGTILQNRLSHSLPVSVLSQFPANTEIAYNIIPQVPCYLLVYLALTDSGWNVDSADATAAQRRCSKGFPG